MKRTWVYCFAASILILAAGAPELASPAITVAPPLPTARPDPESRKVDPSGAIFNVAEFIDEKRGYALGNVAGYPAGATMWTEDGGTIWSYNDLILTGCVQFCDVHGLDVVDEDLIWAGTDYSSVYY